MFGKGRELGFIDEITDTKSSKVASSSTNRIAASSIAPSLSMSYAKQAEAASAKFAARFAIGTLAR